MMRKPTAAKKHVRVEKTLFELGVFCWIYSIRCEKMDLTQDYAAAEATDGQNVWVFRRLGDCWSLK